MLLQFTRLWRKNQRLAVRTAAHLCALSMILALPSCLVVKREVAPLPERSSDVSPRAGVAMSDEIVYSEQGDMVVRLPQDWFFVDIGKEVSSNVIAAASNSDYTLSLVFSELRANENLIDLHQNEGLLGVARAGFRARERKTAGAVKQLGEIELRELGARRFGIYEFSDNNGATFNLASVFKTSLNNFYEVALVQMADFNRPVPPRDSVESIFSAVLTTVVY